MSVSPTSPKEQWLADTSAAAEWEQFVSNPLFKRGLTFALAEYAHGMPSADALRGAVSFMSVLVNLSTTPKNSPMPSKQLTQG